MFLFYHTNKNFILKRKNKNYVLISEVSLFKLFCNYLNN